MSTDKLPHAARVEQQLRLANDLELAAEERAELGDAREANELRQKAAAVRRAVQEQHNAHVAEELNAAKAGAVINLSDLMAARESFS